MKTITKSTLAVLTVCAMLFMYCSLFTAYAEKSEQTVVVNLERDVLSSQSQISVGTQSQVYKYGEVKTVSYDVILNIAEQGVASVKWYSDENGTAESEAPTGAVADAADVTTVYISSDGTTNAGVYYFRYCYGTYESDVCTFTVAVRSVTLTSDTYERIYDGFPLTQNGVTITGDGFIDGEGITYDVVGSQTDVGSSENVFYYDLKQGTLSANYDIQKVYGTLTVTPREITVTTDSDERVYDGTPLTNYGYVVTGDMFAGEDGITVDITGSQTNAGQSPNTFDYTFYQGTNELNYVINSVYGTLTVNKREITYTSASDKKPYDGTPLTNSEITQSGDFAEGEGATATAVGSQLSAGECKNTIEYVLNEGTNGANYEITKNEGTLTVERRVISFESESGNKLFDGTPLTLGGVKIGNNGFIDGEGASFDVYGSQTEVGESENTFDYILNAGTNAANYDIQRILGILSVSVPFKDISQTAWYTEYLNKLSAKGVIVGMGNNDFAPTEDVTRAQFVQILAKLQGVDTTDKNVTVSGVNDIKVGCWYAPAAKWAYDNGIVNGTSAHTFDGNKPLTRAEMSVMVANYAHKCGITLPVANAKKKYDDDGDIPDWAVDAVYAMQAAGIMTGKRDNKFFPLDNATRAEAARVAASI